MSVFDDFLSFLTKQNKKPTPLSIYEFTELINATEEQIDELIKQLRTKYNLKTLCLNVYAKNYLTVKQIEDLIKHSPEKWKVILLVGFYFGLTKNEAINLKYYHLKEKYLMIFQKKRYLSEEMKNILIPLAKRKNYLLSLKQGKKLSYATVDKFFSRHNLKASCMKDSFVYHFYHIVDRITLKELLAGYLTNRTKEAILNKHFINRAFILSTMRPS